MIRHMEQVQVTVTVIRHMKQVQVMNQAALMMSSIIIQSVQTLHLHKLSEIL